jgi:ubiquinone biosynthesis protein COQ4
MTATTATTPFERVRRRPRPDWPRAVRAARALLDDTRKTDMAFEVAAALEPDAIARNLAVMVAHPEGRRLFKARPDLMAALCDRAALQRLPDGSLGRAYLDHIDRYGLSPTKLVELRRARRGAEAAADDLVWFGERRALLHDLRHVLTGYGADPRGEAQLLWFSFGDEGGRANALLMLGATRRLLSRYGLGFLAACWRAYRRGRRAALLSAMPFEALLAAPLAEVRRLAGIPSPLAGEG